jgi:formylmethanofuran dehydrogenase subunit E-like metal-binding protein
LREGGKAEVVSYEGRIDTLQKVAERDPSEKQIREMSALVCLKFFQAMKNMEGRTAAARMKTDANSQTMRVLECVAPGLMKTW